ncbi:MAG: hypothetical protein LBI03_01360 [Clostridiales bacterium]|jgi:hypothetical protein|nr:hypothetical protein [Clostridiales bacterium]
MNNIKDLQITDIPQQEIHITRENLKVMVEKLLERLLKRKIPVEIYREDYYDMKMA